MPHEDLPPNQQRNDFLESVRDVVPDESFREIEAFTLGQLQEGDRAAMSGMPDPTAAFMDVLTAHGGRLEALESSMPGNAYRRKVDDGHHHMQPVEGFDDDVSLGFGYQINWRYGITAARDSWPSNRRFDVDAVGAGFCYDYVVMAGWAGDEGQEFPKFDEVATFKMFSTVEGATDDGIANLARAFSVLVCTGSYVEDLEIPDFSHEIHIYGMGRDATIIGGNTVASHDINTADVWFWNLTLDGPAAGYSLTSGVSENCEVHCHNVIFRKRMAGDHSGSEFYDCIWEGGIQFEADDTPDSVFISGGVCAAPGIDFSVATNGKDNWRVLGLRMTGAATLKLRQNQNSYFNLLFRSEGGTIDDQVLFDDENSLGIVLDCLWRTPANAGQVIRVAAGVTAQAIKVFGNFQYTAIADAGTRHIKSEGIADSWHIDASFQNSATNGPHIEDDGGISVSGVFVDSKFTLVPTDAQVNTTAGSSGNVVDSGVITGGSVGIEGPGEVRKIIDADGDTSWDTEQAADEDVLRAKTGGTERFKIDDNQALFEHPFAYDLQADTIVSGLVTATRSWIALAGEGAADDFLAGVTGGTAGDLLMLTPSGVGVITVNHEDAGGEAAAAERFTTRDADNVVLTNALTDNIVFLYFTSRWRELARNIAPGAWKVLYTNATTNVELALGAAGTILAGQGAAAAPAFDTMSADASIAAGGAVTVAETHSGTPHTNIPTQTAALDMGGYVINGVADPVLGTDAVNFDTLLDSIAIALHYYFGAALAMAPTFSAGEDKVTKTLDETPEEITEIIQVASGADTPTPFTVSAGTIASIHFDAKVFATAGTRPVTLHVQLGYVDADGSSNWVQLGADSDQTAILTEAQTTYEMHIHIAAGTTVPATKRLKVKWYATTTGAANWPIVWVYYGAVGDHINIPVSASILGNYLRQDGTKPLTGNWDAGSFKITVQDLVADARLAVGIGAVDADTRLVLLDIVSHTSGEKRGLSLNIESDPGGASSGRQWGLQFNSSTATGNAQNYTDSLGVMGLEATATHKGTGIVTGLVPGAFFLVNTAAGTVTDGSSIYVFTPTNSGGGHITNSRLINLAGQVAFSANNQTRFGLYVPATPDPGGFTGTTGAGIYLAGTSGAMRDGILFGGDTWLYRSAADTLRTPDALTVDGLFTASGGGAHSIADNAVVTVDDADAADDDFAKFTAAGLEGRSAAEVRTDIGLDFRASITVESPDSSEDISITFTNRAVTITEMRAVLANGAATPSVTWTIRHGTDRSAAGAEVVTGGTPTTSISTGSDVTAFDDATIIADSHIWLETTAQSGTVPEFHVTLIGTID